MNIVTTLIALGAFVNAAAAFEIPKGLSATDREEVVSALGLNSAIKPLSNPYPLGGYSGLELGCSVEFINLRDVRRLGCAPGAPGCANTSYSNETDWRYSRLSVGKGLFYDVDVFLSFIPPMGNLRFSDYGGLFRWSFFQAQFLPINLSLLVHANQSNFNDVFMNRNMGSEILAGVNVDNFALYFGGGFIEAQGTFIGTDSSNVCGEDCTVSGSDPLLDPTSRTTTVRLKETHTVVGFSLHEGNLFAAAEVDRYRDAVYSLKLGLRF